jgi:hypothetical protein
MCGPTLKAEPTRFLKFNYSIKTQILGALQVWNIHYKPKPQCDYVSKLGATANLALWYNEPRSERNTSGWNKVWGKVGITSETIEVLWFSFVSSVRIFNKPKLERILLLLLLLLIIIIIIIIIISSSSSSSSSSSINL